MHVELSTILIALPFISSVVLVVKVYQMRKEANQLILEPEDKGINYPTGTMFDNYLQIKRDLQMCATKEQVLEQYIPIYLFSCHFKDSDSFTNELVDLYNSVEAEYLNPI